jgi:hypothetical protein
MQGASSRGLRSPSEFVVQSPARALARAGASRRVSSLFATSVLGISLAGSRPTRIRPQRFTRSRRLAPPRALRIYFTALPRPGFRYRGLLLQAGRITSSVTSTLAPLAPSACRLPGASERRVDLRVVLPSRVRGARPAGEGLPSLVSPPAFQTPSGIRQKPGPCHRTSSARGLRLQCCVCPAGVTLSVSISLCLSPLSPEARPVRALRPSSRLPFP